MKVELTEYSENQISTQQLQQQLKTQDIEVSQQQSEDTENLMDYQTSYFQLLKAGMGTGILFTPYVFNESGIIGGLILLATCPCILLISYELLLAVLDKQEYKRMSMKTAAETILDQGNQVSFCLFFYNIGTNIIYMAVILESFDFLVMHPKFSGDYRKVMGMKILILSICFCLYLPFIMKKYLLKLKYFTQAGVFISLAIISLVIINNIYILTSSEQQQQMGFNKEFKIPKLDLTYFPMNYGIVLFLYDINGTLTSVRKQMKNPQQDFRKSLKYYFITVFLVSSLLGILGVLTYREYTADFVFINLEQFGLFQGKIINMIACAFAMTLVVNIVLYSEPLCEQLDSFMFQKSLKKTNQTESSFGQQLIIRTSLFGLEAIVALLIPSAARISNVIGCIFSVLLGFYFPYKLYTQVFAHSINNHDNNILIKKIVIIAGILGGVIGFVDSFIAGVS